MCHVSLPLSYRSRQDHIHLLRVLPLVGCRSKTPTAVLELAAAVRRATPIYLRNAPSFCSSSPVSSPPPPLAPRAIAIENKARERPPGIAGELLRRCRRRPSPRRPRSWTAGAVRLARTVQIKRGRTPLIRSTVDRWTKSTGAGPQATSALRQLCVSPATHSSPRGTTQLPRRPPRQFCK
jgi:hypothetical protein